MTAAVFHLPESWPAPSDRGAAERLIERFAAVGRTEARLARNPRVKAMLSSLGGNSHYLADLAVREAAALCELVAAGPDPVAGAALDALRAVPPNAKRDCGRGGAAPRQARRRTGHRGRRYRRHLAAGARHRPR